MKFKQFIARILSSPIKVIAKIVLYFTKFLVFCLFEICIGLFVGMANNTLFIDLAYVFSAFAFFGIWTYSERKMNSDEETDYTEILKNRNFSFSYEFKDVLHRFKWNLILETAVFYIVFTCFIPMTLDMIQHKAISIPAIIVAYLSVPILNVLIWVRVRKDWHKKYRRWSRHKQTQEFVDTSYDDIFKKEQ